MASRSLLVAVALVALFACLAMASDMSIGTVFVFPPRLLLLLLDFPVCWAQTSCFVSRFLHASLRVGRRHAADRVAGER
jgi:hypothetical protein